MQKQKQLFDASLDQVKTDLQSLADQLCELKDQQQSLKAEIANVADQNKELHSLIENRLNDNLLTTFARFEEMDQTLNSESVEFHKTRLLQKAEIRELWERLDDVVSQQQ